MSTVTQEKDYGHVPVLLHECLDALAIKPDGIYVDGTLGRAGHSLEIVKRLTTGRLIGIDRDETAIAAARDAGAFVCYAPRMAEAAPCWPDAAALRETALQFFPQADVLLLKDSDLVPLFGSHELRTALFSLFSGHVELIFYSSSDDIFLFTRNVLLQAATSDLTEAQFLRDLARLNTWPDKLAGLRETTLKKLFL